MIRDTEWDKLTPTQEQNFLEVLPEVKDLRALSLQSSHSLIDKTIRYPGQKKKQLWNFYFYYEWKTEIENY
jgi:hypothetical protein